MQRLGDDGAAEGARGAGRRTTLMGTSASSGTVRTYLAAHPNLRMPDEKPIFDGFLLTSTNGNTPLPVVDVPMIQMPTQTEVVTWAEQGIAYRRPDSDDANNRFRLYEVAAMPHNNSRDSPGFRNDPCTLPVTDFPAGAFTALALNHLVGREFLIGEVRLRGIRLCEPCTHLAQLTSDKLLPALIHRGGLRAQILTEGWIRPGMAIRP